MKDSQETIRLQKYLAQCGVASRRKCEEYIEAGRVQVNGITMRVLGTKVHTNDNVMFDGNVVTPANINRYIALNKPKGYLCAASDTYQRPLALDLFKDRYPERLFSIGRLDLNSSGLIFFTNDGEFAKTVSHPSSRIEKEYIVESFEPVNRHILDEFKRGVIVDGIKYRIADYRIPYERRARITLIEGKNRELRRLYQSKGIHITRIHRIRIGPVELGPLQPGEHRSLKSNEISALVSLSKRYVQ